MHQHQQRERRVVLSSDGGDAIGTDGESASALGALALRSRVVQALQREGFSSDA